MAVFEPRVAEVASPDLSITERIFEGLDISASQTVMVDGATGAKMTGAEVKDRIARFAGGMTAAGLCPGKVIALLAPNVPDYVTVFHGVAYGGGTVTTMNPTYTAPEIHHQLMDSGAVALVTVPAFVDLARKAMEGTQAKELIVIGKAEACAVLMTCWGIPLRRRHRSISTNLLWSCPIPPGRRGGPRG